MYTIWCNQNQIDLIQIKMVNCICLTTFYVVWWVVAAKEDIVGNFSDICIIANDIRQFSIFDGLKRIAIETMGLSWNIPINIDNIFYDKVWINIDI